MALLFVISVTALFYASLAYALSDLWHSGRTESDVNAGQSAGILFASNLIAAVAGFSLRSTGRGSHAAGVVLLVGILAACMPWVA